MFSKSRQTSETAPAATRNRSGGERAGTFSVLGADVAVRGDIDAATDLHIDGQIEGDVRCAALVQGESSLITGNVIADSVRLAGRVDGSIDAGDLVIEAGAEVRGNVAYDTLTIAAGARIDGALRHKGGDSGAAEDAPAAEPSADLAPDSTRNSTDVESIELPRDVGIMRA